MSVNSESVLSQVVGTPSNVTSPTGSIVTEYDVSSGVLVSSGLSVSPPVDSSIFGLSVSALSPSALFPVQPASSPPPMTAPPYFT
ncbi:hypothetical protein GBQ70_15350 [Halomicrobium sp. ZPS1]|uniref:Uncharacterized protein n=1 Tax=Halomicrobium mukohataei TaxID=57705 RepID=A0A4D6KJX2_9EURY|nr:hypothetical protein E5139_15330 [Halomicrobium mukohataei]QFR21759.1 hypothetical protein GBQ70_15350 [Halomicrobium sp. ZPS1]